MAILISPKEYALRFRFLTLRTTEADAPALEAMLRVAGAYGGDGSHALPGAVPCTFCEIQEAHQANLVRLRAPVEAGKPLALRGLRDGLGMGLSHALMVCQVDGRDGAIQGFHQMTNLCNPVWKIGPWDMASHDPVEEELTLRFGRYDFRP